MPDPTNPTSGLPAVFLDALTAERPALKSMATGIVGFFFSPVMSFILSIAEFVWSIAEPILKSALSLVPLGVIARWLESTPTKPTRPSVLAALAKNGFMPKVMAAAPPLIQVTCQRNGRDWDVDGPDFAATFSNEEDARSFAGMKRHDAAIGA